MKALPSSPLWTPQPAPRSRATQRRLNHRRQKKGRPFGRPHIALDCCAPYVYPYTVETSLQLALPAPCKYVGTSLLASLLKINICHQPVSVKQILIFSQNNEICLVYILFINKLYNFVIFNILKIYAIFVRFFIIHPQYAKETDCV